MELPEIFAAYPAVYAVGKEYQIFVPVTAETLMWVKVGEEEYYDDSNGILRSASPTHRMVVPMAELDAAKHYTICFRRVIERLPYFSKTGEVETAEFDFRPLPEETIRLYHIADAHNREAAPLGAGRYFGDKLDLLILNGDIPDDSGDVANFKTIHYLVGELTHGEIPTVFSRGNHDLRGICAEKLAEHTPTRNGNSYFTFRLGAVWGIVLDCGEDKVDEQPAYGNTVCCHAFRKRETEYLRQVIADAEHEYAAEGIKYRLVISHVPFTYVQAKPFDIEQPIYAEWCKLLKENVHPDLMLSGHLHAIFVSPVGGEHDHLGQPCPVVCGSVCTADPDFYIGAAVTLAPEEITVTFNNHNGKEMWTEKIPLNCEK